MTSPNLPPSPLTALSSLAETTPFQRVPEVETWKSFVQDVQENKERKLCHFGTRLGQEFIEFRQNSGGRSIPVIEKLERMYESLSAHSSTQEREQENPSIIHDDAHNPATGIDMNTENSSVCLNHLDDCNSRAPDTGTVKHEELTQITDHKPVLVNRWMRTRAEVSRNNIDKEAKKRRLNAKIRQYMNPKSPLTAFQELYGNRYIRVTMVSRAYMPIPVYTASIEIDGRVWTAQHVSQIQAKQMACEFFFRDMLKKKLSNGFSEHENASSAEDVGNGAGGQSSHGHRDRPPDEEAFPWAQYTSIAMDHLIRQWQLRNVKNADYEAAGGTQAFPNNPENFHPVSLLNKLRPYVIFRDKIIRQAPASLYEVCCTTGGFTFIGHGPTKKHAKLECAIETIKHFWHFNYRNL